MAIFDSGDKVRKWKYITKFFKFSFSDGKTLDVPTQQVKEFSMEENYEEYYFPLIKVKLVLDSDSYYTIIKNKNNCKINLRIDKFYFGDDTETNPSTTRKFINDTFELIMDENTEDMYNSLKEDENRSDYKRKKKNISDQLEKIRNELSFYLFKPIISSVKQNVNKVFENINVSDAIVYLATISKINNILMTPPDNINIYKEFLLPPLSILRSLEFIDLYYGIYKDSTMIYFGLDYTYIIPYNGKCTVYYKGETYVTNIIIPKSTNLTHQNKLGNLNKMNDKNKNYIVADYSSINIENQSISNDYINANNIQAIDSYDESILDSNSGAITKDDKNFTRIVENKTMNPYYASMYAKQSKGKSIIVSLRLQDFDISNITPNKEFNLIFEDTTFTKKYNGRYLVSGINNSFLSNGKYLEVSSIVVLRKMD